MKREQALELVEQHSKAVIARYEAGADSKSTTANLKRIETRIVNALSPRAVAGLAPEDLPLDGQ